MKEFKARHAVIALMICSLLTGCSGSKKLDPTYPKSKDQLEEARMGKLTGEEGMVIFGGKNRRSAGSNGIGVNSYLWRATLDTVYTMPLASADPFGGTVLTDWQQLPGNPNERFKLNIVIVTSDLRTDGVKVSAFKQIRRGAGWEEAKVHPALAQEIEEKILKRARDMRYHRAS